MKKYVLFMTFFIGAMCFVAPNGKSRTVTTVINFGEEKKAGQSATLKPSQTPQKNVIEAPYLESLPQSRHYIAQMIQDVFKDDFKTAYAVFRAESGLRPDAKGYNCMYTAPDGTHYSTACKTEDRYRAWSVDCGIAQINVKGQECPAELMDPAYNIQKAYEWKFKNSKTFHAWSAYNNGSYKSFIN
jgi:hypothetical protein